MPGVARCGGVIADASVVPLVAGSDMSVAQRRALDRSQVAVFVDGDGTPVLSVASARPAPDMPSRLSL
jgi:hypothetical protein